MSTKPQDGDAPWRDEDRLRELYWDEGLCPEEMAPILGCTERTIWTWIGKHDMETRRPGQRQSPWVTYGTDKEGYEWWQNTCGPDRKTHVYVHTLVAIAEHGFEAVVGNHVHHKNRVPWDNRPENLEVLTASEHMKHHGEGANRGEENPRSMLSREDVAEIKARRDEFTRSEMAEKFGVAPSTIEGIWYEKNWSHVDPEEFGGGS